MPILKRYGWHPDKPDVRDKLFHPKAIALPSKADLRPHMPPVYNQGDLGSCTANAIAGAIQYERRRQKLLDVTPSRLFIYYNERAIEGTTNEDAGAEIRDGIKAVAKWGAPPEAVWPYHIAKFTIKPSAAAYSYGHSELVIGYCRVEHSMTQIKTALAENLPVIFGFSVYESFETEQVARTGVMPLPEPGEECVGGHAVLAVGFDDSQSALIVRNSWGADWGKNGYFLMPYAFVRNATLASDFWTISKVEA